MNSPQSTHASTAAASHTPGPWKAIKRGVGTDWIVIPADHEKRPDNWILAECRYQSNDEANARLIAAAPELLEALKRAEQCLNLTRIQFMQAPISASLPTTAASIGDDLFAVRAAIAKATGTA